MNLYLLECLCDFVFNLCVLDLKSLKLISELGLTILERVSSSDRCLLHALELETYILDKLLLSVFEGLHLPFDLLGHILVKSHQSPINCSLEIEQVHFKLPQLQLIVH